MECQRCTKNQGEFLCCVCNGIVCSDCKVVENGKVYCLDHRPRPGEKAPAEQQAAAKPQEAAAQEQPKPKPQSNSLKTLIYADLALLIGISAIFFISNTVIAGMMSSNFDVIMDNFPQLTFVFTLMQYFNSFGLYAIITLVIILVISVALLLRKKR